MSGEQCQTHIIEHQNSIHRNLSRLNDGAPLFKPLSSRGSPRPFSDLIETRNLLTPSSSRCSNLSNAEHRKYGSVNSTDEGTMSNTACVIRFQVVIWNIGKLDVVSGSVTMTFRVSLFWNDTTRDDGSQFADDGSATVNSMNVWKMHGRQKAFQQELKDIPIKALEVPPLSILNVSTFETIGAADVDMLREDTRLMRWTCMYRATVVQDNLRVDDFPHDAHDIHLKLGILSARGQGKAWDRRVWKLALATVDDTQCSTRIPHGLIVDQARLPGFSYNKERGLDFQFCALDHGNNTSQQNDDDMYLKIALNVLRQSGYYDKNIVPLLALMNVVAVSVLTFEDTEFFYRGLITLNIAFVEMGIRMTTDAHLPSVGYEIRLQRILNEFFVVLMLLVLEAMSVYVLRTYFNVDPNVTRLIDWMMGIFALSHNVWTLTQYYESKRRAKRRLDKGGEKKGEKML